MKIALLVIVSIIAGVLSAEHFHSFALGLGVAVVAMGACYWFAFRSSRFPELALFLLCCGMFSKLAITVAGVAWGISANVISSPIIFALSYLFFSIVVASVGFGYRYRRVQASS
ncbi:NADH:ubiquinone oxidoreductase [Vibrio profundum]|uniref:NADH:ubiquinone oxidoreductase n=1 Tax=Vibrio profundum TaxID=2910247 RepID=UPI003D14DE2B